MLFRRVLARLARSKSSAVASPTASAVLHFDDMPSPRGLPLVGTTLALMAAGSAPHLHEYIDGRHKQLGAVFKEKIGPLSAVFVADPDVMRDVFDHEGKYPVHMLPEPWVVYNRMKGCPRGLFFMDGADWWHHRRILNSILLKGDTEWIQDACDVVADHFVEVLDTLPVTDLKVALYKWSLDVIVAVLLGAPSYKQHRKYLDSQVENLAQIVHLVFETTSKLQMIPVPLAAKLNIPQWSRFMEAVTTVLQGTKSLVQTLNTLTLSKGLLSQLQQELKPEDINRIISDLIMASGDTTAVSLEWMLYLTAKNKQVQTQLRSRPEFARFVLRETLRLYPIATFLTRILPEDSVLGGYEVPKGTLVVSSLYTSGRDEQYFPDPHSFKPERWDRKGDMYNSMMQKCSMAFGHGLRSCVGRKIAESQLQTTLVKVVKKFEIECCNEKDVKMVMKMVAHPSEPVLLRFKRL